MNHIFKFHWRAIFDNFVCQTFIICFINFCVLSFVTLILSQYYSLPTYMVEFSNAHQCLVEITYIQQVRRRGVLHHVCNSLIWYGGGCEPDTLTEPPMNIHGVPVDYFVRGDSVFALLQKILMDKIWIKSLKCFVRFRYGGYMYYS